MHALLTAIGTDGDIFPLVGLGAELRSRGHEATLVASAHYEPLARAHGLDFQSLVSEDENQELFGHPDFWNFWKSALLIARWGLRRLDRQYRLLRGLTKSGTVWIANPAVLAAAMAAERAGVPWATVILQPGLIPSSLAPPILPGLAFLRWAPKAVWRGFWPLFDLFGHCLVGRQLNRLRSSVGLPPWRRVLRQWMSPQRVLGLFPAWYGPPAADWPNQLRLTGFPMLDGPVETDLPPSLAEFCQSGEPPLALTFGSGMAHSAALFRVALEACGHLGRRAVLLTRFRDQLPASLPAGCFHAPFAPFQTLFPRCAAVVHHGGIGTVAKALATGLPQLIRPICFDQEDNADRVQRLGAGDWLRFGPRDARRLASALSGILSPATQARCRDLSTRVAASEGLPAAARWIERLESDTRSA